MAIRLSLLFLLFLLCLAYSARLFETIEDSDLSGSSDWGELELDAHVELQGELDELNFDAEMIADGLVSEVDSETVLFNKVEAEEKGEMEGMVDESTEVDVDEEAELEDSGENEAKYVVHRHRVYTMESDEELFPNDLEEELRDAGKHRHTHIVIGGPSRRNSYVELNAVKNE